MGKKTKKRHLCILNENNSIMSGICQLTGKRPRTGNRVSFSNKKSKRWFRPNLQTKRFYIPEEDKWIRLKVSTQAIRTIKKKGIYAYLKELEKKEGLYFDY